MNMKHSFRNDYGRFAHPRILQAIAKYGEELNDPYGLDVHSKNAAELLRKTFGAEGAEVHFFVGGTVTNMVFLSYVLKDYECVIAADTAHINVHETGAIEGSGHKVLVAQNVDGKLTVEGIDKLLKSHTDEHMVLPRAVYISNATETGTLYTKSELRALRDFCKEKGLYLYMDGARLGAALTAKENDISPAEVGSFCDAFYVGGGKNGLGIGEALILVNKDLQVHFRHHIKNKGAMLAKGYLLGIEFEEGFRDGLFFDIAKKENQQAIALYHIFLNHDYDLPKPQTNQVFCTFDDELAEALVKEFGCEVWQREEGKTMLRFVTSYATNEEDLLALDAFLPA